MNIVERLSTDKSKIYYTLEWGRKAGERFSTGIFTYAKPKNKIEREYNTESLANLDLLRSQTLLDLQTKGRGFVSPAKMKENFIDFFEKYADKNKSDNNRSLACCLSAFKKFTALDQGKLEIDAEDLSISAADISANYCERFRKYLLDNLNGETPADYFMRFKKMLIVAQESGYFRINPAEKLKCLSHPPGEKDVLEKHEYPLLLAAACKNLEVKKAVVSSLYSGLRWCDVKPLTWWQIKDDVIVLRRQTKTGVPLKVPLHPVIKAILGTPGEPNELVFKLPCYETVLDIIQDWVDAAGIKKKITYHCLRHSVSDILLEAGLDVHTVAAFLGQKTAKQILERYKKRVRQGNMEKASAALPDLDTVEDLSCA
jgi:integrase